MASASPAQPAPVKRRLKKRVVIPLVIVGVLGAALLWAYVRGTWADSAARDPAGPDDGVVVQLLRTADGHTTVRCAAVVDRPAEKVWAVVTDYDHYGEIFPTLASAPVRVTPEAGGVVRLQGVAGSWLGDWPFDIRIAHEETAEKRVASWNGAGGDIVVNRGSFTVTPHGAGQALLVYSLEVELASYPNFIVRNVLLSRQPGVLRALVERARQ